MPLPIGLVYDGAGHVILDPDTAIAGALRHLFATFEAAGSATAVVKAFRAAGLSFPWRHRKGPRKGEVDWQPLLHSTVLRVLHNPRYAGVFTYGRTTHPLLPGGKASTRHLPRDQWTSFIPGAHPGYITLDQYEANIARLAANAAAHGRDRAAGPPREGPALLQGVIICGRCGNRMTVRYHARGGKDLPTYVCQRDGIENARRICAAIPGHTLDEHVGQLLISTLTPLAVEAALQVSAEPQQRAADADALRAAHVERARYHADLARRRYLAVDPANRLVAGTLEAGWNTALRALNDAQAAYDQAREQHTGQLTDAQKDRIAQLVTDLPGIWNDPATPMRERKRIARPLLTDVTMTRTSDTITAHVRLAGGQHRTLTLPVPSRPGRLEHPGFGGDSILPRCSGLGGRCLPRYRRMAEPRSDHFSAFVLSNICPAALSSCPAWWRAPPARPPAGAWASPRRAPAFAPAGSPGWARVTRSVIACDAGGALDLGGGSVAPVPRPARRCPPAAAPAVTCRGISEEGRGPGRSPGGCGRSPPGS